MIINLFDGRALHNPYWGAAAPRDHVVRMVASPRETLANIVRRVKESSEGPRSIWLLRIISHGNSGLAYLGSENLSSATSRHFAQLNGHFSPRGRGIAIHACGVASSRSICGEPGWLDSLLADGQNACILRPGTFTGSEGAGVRFLKELSRLSGTAVRAGVNTQWTDADFRFEGPSVAVSNDGSVAAISGSDQFSRDTVDPFVTARRPAMQVPIRQ